MSKEEAEGRRAGLERIIQGEYDEQDGIFREEHAKLFEDTDPLKFLSNDPEQQVHHPMRFNRPDFVRCTKGD